MSGWISDTLEANDYKYLKNIDFEKNLDKLNRCYNKLQRQLIHRDLHLGNFLFNNCEFSGYIDFDLSQKNIRIFDICYFLLRLLIDHKKNSEHIDK
ncbi:homoserine kinase [Clostridium puniceum]|uniref:Homoserine kinase n=1 Tax=Clostridium puniceum TaxID=29367 RepID=A0A1S8TUT8_9CLOT|nr:phosphotransferase [Clostridium puniceum]OOM81514.1 homoserine kinase [Clostridium puniceum]